MNERERKGVEEIKSFTFKDKRKIQVHNDYH